MEKITGKGRKICFDTENVGLLDDVNCRSDMHVVHCVDMISKETFCFFDDYEFRVDAECLGELEDKKDGTIEDGIKFILEADCIIIQNGTGYDFHVFEKIYPELMDGFDYFEKTGDAYFPFKVMDTYTMSCTLNPERRAPYEAKLVGAGNVGAHSIEAHGIRIGRYKPENEDWSRLTSHMLHRCSEDTEIGASFYHYLMKEWYEQLSTPSVGTNLTIADAYYCELRFAFALARQANRGFRLDMGFASDLLAEIDKEAKETESMFRPMMPKKLEKSKISYSNTQVKFQEAYLTPEMIVELNTHTHGSSSATCWSITTKPTKRGSKYSSVVTKHYPEAVGYIEDHKSPVVIGSFTPVSFTDYPLGNREVVKQVIYNYGWRGVNFNDVELSHNEVYYELVSSGKRKVAATHGEFPNPWSGKIDEASIKVWEETGKVIPEWALGIARWYILQSRRNQILNEKDVVNYKTKGKWTSHGGKPNCRGLVPKAICSSTGVTGQKYFEANGFFPDSGEWRVPAIAFHAATNTFRCRHRNVVNIPSRGIYGKEMRKLFIAADDSKLIGCDGAGLELRMLAHFMNDDEYIDTVLNGDIHAYNQAKAALPTRDMSKTFIYALLYGSGIPNLARTCGVSTDTMDSCVEEFKRSLPALDRLLKGVQGAAERRGFMLGLDGRRGRIREKGGKPAVHTALNVLLQMSGSLVMKWGHIFAEDIALDMGIIENVGEFPMVAHQHDEAQMEDITEYTEEAYFTFHKDDWSKEEKSTFKDPEGRQWSAPTIHEVNGDYITVIRYYSAFGDCYAQGIKKAGEFLGLRIQTAGEYLVGNSWKDTH